MKTMRTMILLGIIIHLAGCSPGGANEKNDQSKLKILSTTKLSYKVNKDNMSTSKCAFRTGEGRGCGVDVHLNKCHYYEADAIVVGRYGKGSFISHCDDGKYGSLMPVNLFDVDVLHHISGEDFGKTFKLNTLSDRGLFIEEGDIALMAVTRGENGELFLTGNIYILPDNGQNLGYTDKRELMGDGAANYIVDLPTTVSGLKKAFNDFDVTKATECPEDVDDEYSRIGAYRQYSFLIGELCDEPPKFSFGDSGESGPESDLAGD